MTSSQHEPEHDPVLRDQVDQDMTDRQAGMDHVDGGELTRRIAEASRRDGARA